MFRKAKEEDIPFINIGLKELNQPTINQFNTIDSYTIYTEHNKPISFADYTISDGIMDLCGIYVIPEKRRMGIGNKTMLYLIHYCHEYKISTIMIEVRPSNIAALNLYKRYGFKKIATRINYYPKTENAPREDALIMHKKIHFRKRKETYEE